MTESETTSGSDTLIVLYYEADPEARAVIKSHESWQDVTVETIEDNEAARSRLDTKHYDGFILEPTSLPREDSTFLDTIEDIVPTVPVLLYTERGADELDDALVSTATTLVEKGESIDESLTLLRHKVEAGSPSSTSTATESTATTKFSNIESELSETGPGALDSYEILVEAARDGIYVLDSDGRYQYANESMADLIGYDAEELVGVHASQVLAPGELERGQALIREMVSAGESESDVYDMTLQTKDGEEILTGVHFTVLYDGETYAGIVGVVRDITERKKRESELKRQNERLDEFASIVAHDLRNPLQVTQARIELAGDECSSDHLERAEAAVDRAVSLVEDLLALAREGEQTYDLEPVDLKTVVENCWSTVETVDASLRIEDNPIIQAEPGRLKQLFENLFRNAIEHGGDDVTVTVGGLARGVYVADDGVGIPDTECDRVFDSGYSTSDEGTGFGLNIVAEIAEAHDWEITVTESQDGGARFEITDVDVVH